MHEGIHPGRAGRYSSAMHKELKRDQDLLGATDVKTIEAPPRRPYEKPAVRELLSPEDLDISFHTEHEPIAIEAMSPKLDVETTTPMGATFPDGMFPPLVQTPKLNMDHPIVKALLSMNRVQRRAFNAELRALRKFPKKGLDRAWQAARARGWRGVIPAGPVALGMEAERVAGFGPDAR